MAKDHIDVVLKNPSARKLLIDLGGENTLAVIKALKVATEDEEIADMLGLRVSDVRAVLNKLNEAGFAYYERTKDEESGWYYYHWKIDKDKLKTWVEEKLFHEAQKYRNLIMEGEYYFCPKCGLETVVKFEDAMDMNFKCPRCETPLELLDETVIDTYIANATIGLNANQPIKGRVEKTTVRKVSKPKIKQKVGKRSRRKSKR